MKPATFALLLLFLGCGASAQELQLSDVPRECPAEVRASLEARRARLLSAWDTFLCAKAAFLAQFAGTEDGTPRAAEAQRKKTELQRQADALVDEADRFNADVEKAVGKPR